MTFWDHFLRVVFRRPIPALAALYWHLTRRRVRARNRLRVASADLPFAYAVWMASNEPEPELSSQCKATMKSWTSSPSFCVIIYSDSAATKSDMLRSTASVKQQLYPQWTLVDSDIDDLEVAIGRSSADFVLPLRAGVSLARTALFRFAEAAQANPEAEILYSDEDRIDKNGRRTAPWFKPKWNQELFLALDYISSSFVIEGKLARKAAERGEGDLGALLLIATAQAKSISHIPHVLFHVGRDAIAGPDRISAVRKHLQPLGAECAAGPFGTVRVQWPLPEELPLVSVIVPTRDRLELLGPCVESLLERTSYPNFDVVIIDNGSTDRRTSDYFDQITKNPRVRVIPFAEPYNFSTMNNFAVSQVSSPYICLLNNDTEVVERAWLTEMVRYAVQPHVGAVGAKLLYDDGSIQHAGVIIGLGEAAGHAHRNLPHGDAGYFGQPHVTQFMSAVTAACLVIAREKFLSVGGLDESLAVAFNDVDLCLKLQAAGFRNVYVPHAVLVHHESKTRGSDMERAQFDRYLRELHILQERWGTKTYIDPLHNPNLDRSTETFVLKV